MHTFFINTSLDHLDGYNELLSVALETRRLIKLNCPLSDWLEEENGYKHCVKQIIETIENYKDVTNDYQLIVYVDLIALGQNFIPAEEERESCLGMHYFACQTMLASYIENTLLADLKDSCKFPRHTLIVYEQEVPASNEFSHGHDFDLLAKQAVRLFGFDSIESFSLGTNKNRAPIVPELWNYMPTGVTKSLEENISSIGETFKKVQHECYTTTFIEKRSGGVWTNERETKRIVRLNLFVLECALSERVLQTVSGESGNEIGKKVYPLNWDKFKSTLKGKYKIYQKTARETDKLEQNYVDLKLAPRLYKIANDKFGLDEYGELSTGRCNAFIDTTKNTSFHAAGENDGLPDMSPDELKQAANQEKDRHAKFLRAAKQYVDDVMPHYTVHSIENEPPYLTKRAVTVPNDDYEAEPVTISYTKNEISTNTKVSDGDIEKRSINVVLTSAKNGWNALKEIFFTALNKRTIALTNIDSLCEDFEKKVDSITESLKKAKVIFFSLLAFVFVLFTLPYLILRGQHIWTDFGTVATFLFTIGLPIVILAIVYYIIVSQTKKRYGLEWDKFYKASSDALQQNEEAMSCYIKMLENDIPALRHYNEYLTDVDFYYECCKVARLKVQHHRTKQKAYVEKIGNLLENLDCMNTTDGEIPDLAEALVDRVDFNKAFCEGEKNCKFYTIIGQEEIERLTDNTEEARK